MPPARFVLALLAADPETIRMLRHLGPHLIVSLASATVGIGDPRSGIQLLEIGQRPIAVVFPCPPRPLEGCLCAGPLLQRASSLPATCSARRKGLRRPARERPERPLCPRVASQGDRAAPGWAPRFGVVLIVRQRFENPTGATPSRHMHDQRRPLRAAFRGVATILCLLLPPLCAARDLSEIRASGSLKVLVVPFTTDDEFFSSGSRPGFDHEMVQGFCNLERVELEVVPVPNWDGLIPALRSGKGDLIAGSFSNTEGRRAMIDFTVEVFPTRNLVVTLKPHKTIETLDELRNERIGIVKGTSMAEALTAAGVPKTAVDDTIPAGGLMAAMRQGRVSVGIMGIENAISAQRSDPRLETGVFLGPPGSFAYGVRKDAPELLTALNAYIENVRRTQTWSRLVVKYFGERALELLKSARGSD
jgi:polar amino acid transport system substrate-binding protein